MNRWIAAIRPTSLVTLLIIGVMVYWIVEARSFAPQDRYLPLFASITGLTIALAQLLMDVRGTIKRYRTPGIVEARKQVLDIADESGLPQRVVLARFGRFFAWIAGLVLGLWLVGFSTALLVFVFSYLRFVGKARWSIAIGVTLVIGVIQYVFFETLLGILWPTSLFESLTGISLDIVPLIRQAVFQMGR